MAGIVGALVVRRRRAGTVAAPGPDPAAELRRKLAATRAPEPPPTPPTPPAAPEPPTDADADARRRDVHAQARAAIDEMRGEPTE